MKFKEFKYERPDYDQVKGQLDTLQNELKECSDVNSFMEIFDKINQIRSHVQTMAIAYYRYPRGHCCSDSYIFTQRYVRKTDL
ncbi:MAG: hypothetical protein RSC48_03725 [Anaerorhabdus sp.]